VVANGAQKAKDFGFEVPLPGWMLDAVLFGILD
jgi:hypothetical protein